MAWNLTKTAVQVVIMWSTALWLVPLAMVAIEAWLGLDGFWFTPPFRTAGIVFVLLSAVGLWAGATMAIHGNGTPLPFDTARQLVIRGPYRFMRNPMAITGVGQAMAVGFMLGSLSVVAYALTGGILWHFIIRPPEERELLDRFGEPYRRYREQVPLWRIRLRAYQPGTAEAARATMAP